MYFATRLDDFFGNNAILPSWTLKLPESRGMSNTDFKEEVNGVFPPFLSHFFFFFAFKMAVVINVPHEFSF